MAIKSTEAKLISGMYRVYCDNCNKYLCDAPRSTWTYCPACHVWSREEPAMEVHND